MYSTPPSSQACCSSGSMGREASEIWVSPAQNASKPSPVPAPPTVICTSGFSWAIGCTVLEPSIEIWPETFPPPCSAPAPPPQAARTSDSASRRADTTGSLKPAVLLNPYTPFVERQNHLSFQGPMIGQDDRPVVSIM